VTNHTVTFDGQNGKAKTTKAVTPGKTVGTLPTPTRTGYTFNGWFTAKSGGTKVTTSYKPTKDVTLYAQWTAKKYTVKYYNGSTLLKSVTVAYDSKLNSGTYAPKKTGYNFAGWYTAKSGGDKVDKVTGTMSVFVRYKIKTFSIKFIAFNGEALPSKTLKYGASPGAGPARTGYTFKGWYTAKSGGTKVTKITKTQTLYAQYKIKQYTTKYYDGSKLLKTVKANYNTKLMAGPKKTGYTFDGWFTEKGGKGTKIEKFNANRTVYAHYVKQVTTTYYDETGAKIASVTAKVGSVPKNSLAPVREGKTFDGWYSAKTGGTKVEKLTTSTTKLYARYI
jgi:uncharacterized repeat protein (TIGR02543 family)